MYRRAPLRKQSYLFGVGLYARKRKVIFLWRWSMYNSAMQSWLRRRCIINNEGLQTWWFSVKGTATWRRIKYTWYAEWYLRRADWFFKAPSWLMTVVHRCDRRPLHEMKQSPQLSLLRQYLRSSVFSSSQHVRSHRLAVFYGHSSSHILVTCDALIGSSRRT